MGVVCITTPTCSPRPPGAQDALVEVELAHEAGVGQDARPAAPHVPQCLLQGPPELLHGVGQHRGRRAAQPHAAVHQRPAPAGPAAASLRHSSRRPWGPRRPQGPPGPSAAQLPVPPVAPVLPCPHVQRITRVPKDPVPNGPLVPSAPGVHRDPMTQSPPPSSIPQGPQHLSHQDAPSLHPSASPVLP